MCSAVVVKMYCGRLGSDIAVKMYSGKLDCDFVVHWMVVEW